MHTRVEASLTIPHDDETILPNDLIIRRINPDQHMVMVQNEGRRRLSSKAFSPSSGEHGGMSVDAEKLIRERGQDPHVFVTTPVFTCSVWFTARTIRELGLMIGYEPIPENYAHAEVWGGTRPNRFTGSQQRSLREQAQWYVPPREE